MPRAVVPIDANFPRAATDARDSEEQPVIRAVEMTRGKRELAQLFSHRTFMQRAIVNAQRIAVAVEEFGDSVRRQLAVLECARNALAHQRIDPSRVAGENHASASIAVARVEPSDRERLPSRRVPPQTIEWKFGKRCDEFRNHPRLFAPRFDEFVRALIVNAYVK